MANRMDGLTISGTPGTLTIGSTGISAQTRATILEQDDNVRFPVNFMDFRVHDALQTVLPGTAANDDLALISGTFGTNGPRIQAGDLKAAGATTRYARALVRIPECYVAAQTVTFIISAATETTQADNSCTVDLQVYKLDKDATISADLCTTNATSINATTYADKTFTITATDLSPGDVLDVRVAIACNDAATGTAVTPSIAGFDLCCDIRG